MQASNTTSLSTWFNSIKSDDDIDGGLAADFDGSLSGLGVELGSTTYNMSEALLALPVFKQETFEQGVKTLLEERQRLIQAWAADQCGDYHEVLSPPPQESSYTADVAHVLSSFCCTVGFTYILGASTSPATKVNEETLTYLNQGQSYEIKLKRLGDLGDLKGKLLRSKIRVVFHERRLQYMEKEQLDHWKNTRPGERILDIGTMVVSSIDKLQQQDDYRTHQCKSQSWGKDVHLTEKDIPLSYGIRDIVVDPKFLNLIEFVWDPKKEVGVYSRVHSISTEFTAKKHGGEKGVPFRVQVETYALETDNTERLIHCASCQVKVFKPKGADRKNKTDKERIEKRSNADKDKYQPSYECTVLTEIPIGQVQSYLDQVKKQELESSLNDMQIKKTKKPSAAASTIKSSDMITKATSSLNIEDEVRNFAVISDNSNSNSQDKAPMVVAAAAPGRSSTKIITSITPIRPPKKTGLKKNKSAGSLPSPPPMAEDTMSCSLNSWAETSTPIAINPPPVTPPRPSPPAPPQTPPDKSSEPLAITASANEVTEWLKSNRFQNFVKIFQNFSGADLLRLSREDLIQICSLADGIRLNNALQAKALRPKLTLYVCQMTIKQRLTTPHSEHSTPSPSSSPGNSSLLPMCSRAIPFISPPHFIPPESPEPVETDIYPSEELAKSQTWTVSASDNTATIWSGETISAAKTSAPVVIPSGEAQRVNDPDVSASLDTLMKELVTRNALFSTSPRPSTEHLNIITTAGRVTSQPQATGSEVTRHPHHSRRSGPDVKMSTASLSQSSKRQYREFNEDLDDSEVFYSKKQRTRNLELSKKGVYHALYLDHLTVIDLREKMAALYSLQAAQVKEVYVQGPSGIHVLVTDEVVQNFQEETRYFIEVTQDEDSLGVHPEYYVYLKNST